VLYNTYIDTSNPLLARLPHPSAQFSYFADKNNFFNQYFVKMAWAWSSLAFTAIYLSSPSEVQTWDPILRWSLATGVWMVFTSWFFGPSLFNRLLAYSGAECVIHLPHEPGSTTPHVVAVPAEYCISKTVVSPATHPFLFLNPSSDATLAASLGSSWRATPRLYRGHDVSGHTFLLTLSILFLTAYILRIERRTRSKSENRPGVFLWSLLATWGLVALWFFMLGTTAVFFHSPQEKISGFCESIFDLRIYSTERGFHVQYWDWQASPSPNCLHYIAPPQRNVARNPYKYIIVNFNTNFHNAPLDVWISGKETKIVW
jgi:hypothetical protein